MHSTCNFATLCLWPARDATKATAIENSATAKMNVSNRESTHFL